MIDHGREWPIYDSETVERVSCLVRAGKTFDYRCGDEIRELEESFASDFHRSHCLSFNSGSSALLAAYFALGVRAGDEVVVPNLTYPTTVSSLFILGAIPVLCDSGEETGNVTAAQIEKKITSKTKAIGVVHLWGHSCEMTEIQNLAIRRGIPVVEDCSHAIGARYEGVPVGTFGDVAVFSIGSHKSVSGGMGGILMTDSEGVFALACLLGHARQRADSDLQNTRYHEFADIGLGGNLRISPLSAVLASSHLRTLDVLVRWRAAHLTPLLDALGRLDGISVVTPRFGSSTGAAFACNVCVNDRVCPVTRDELIDRLRSAGARVRAPTTVPLHSSAIFRGRELDGWNMYSRSQRRTFTFSDSDFSQSSRLWSSWISLPMSHFYPGQEELIGRYSSLFEEVVEDMDSVTAKRS